jgi:hypothetical protein
MITEDDLKNAKPQQFKWRGKHLVFKGHFMIQIYIQCDDNGKAGLYVPIYTIHSYSAVKISIHHALANPDFNMLKKLAKDHLICRIKELK